MQEWPAWKDFEHFNNSRQEQMKRCKLLEWIGSQSNRFGTIWSSFEATDAVTTKATRYWHGPSSNWAGCSVSEGLVLPDASVSQRHCVSRNARLDNLVVRDEFNANDVAFGNDTEEWLLSSILRRPLLNQQQHSADRCTSSNGSRRRKRMHWPRR
jgi:hypothetical protein